MLGHVKFLWKHESIIATAEFSSTHFARWMVKKLLLLCLMYLCRRTFFCYIETFWGCERNSFLLRKLLSFKFFWNVNNRKTFCIILKLVFKIHKILLSQSCILFSFEISYLKQIKKDIKLLSWILFLSFSDVFFNKFTSSFLFRWNSKRVQR